MVNEIIEIANKERLKIEQDFPKDAVTCRWLFIEATRVVDFIMLGQPGIPENERDSFSAFDISMIEMGWNLAASMLLKPCDDRRFPIIKKTDELKKYIIYILYNLGITSQLFRIVEMIKTGLVNVEKTEYTYTFYQVSRDNMQFLDELDLNSLRELEKEINASKSRYKNWDLVDFKKIDTFLGRVGNFLSLNDKKGLSRFKNSDIDSLMIPLIKPCNLEGQGTVMGYDTTPEIDNHFLAIAGELTAEWRNEVGVHPNTEIKNVSAAYLMMISSFIIGLHLKHIHFAELASEKYNEILISKSLSIWSYNADLVKDISDLSGVSNEVVEEVLHHITLRPSDTKFLKNYTTRFRPLLIDIGCGLVLRPVSSILRNPFLSAYPLLEFRDSSLMNRLSELREEWIRDYLYAIFSGTRYQRLKGNIKIQCRLLKRYSLL